jgi:hypothetical protein
MKARWILALGILLMAVSASMAPAIEAATTLNVDINNPSCSDTTGNPYCHIQPAINAAPSGALIVVAAGT